MLGCPLDQAFMNGESTNIIKKKKKKDKDKDKNKDIIYENELRPVNDFTNAENDFSQVKQRLQGLSPYDNKYSPYEEINRNIRSSPQLVHRPPEEVKEQQDIVQISNAEYQKYKVYQRERYNKDKLVEGFDSINDNFNDVILFALTGIFFIIFTVYIYKLGKKSY